MEEPFWAGLWEHWEERAGNPKRALENASFSGRKTRQAPALQRQVGKSARKKAGREALEAEERRRLQQRRARGQQKHRGH